LLFPTWPWMHSGGAIIGRKQSVKLPPQAGSASGAIQVPITPQQLTRWAAQAGLKLACNDLDSVATKIADCLEWYPLWAITEQQRDSPAPMRNWCNQVSIQAHDLLFALGLGSVKRQVGPILDAQMLLDVGWDQKGDKDAYAIHQLDRLAQFVVPDRWREYQDGGQQPTGRDVFGSLGYQRLAACLRLLETLAVRAAEYYGRIEQPGGKGRGGSRLDLFIDLSRAYRELFGALPAVARQRRQDDADSFKNSGPSWRFFRLVLEHVHATSKQELDRPDIGVSEERAQWMELSKVASAMSGIAGEGDPLAHLLRESAKAVRAADKRQAARQATQESSE